MEEFIKLIMNLWMIFMVGGTIIIITWGMWHALCDIFEGML